MPIRAVEFVRKLRGGAQAHLLRAEDGHFYAVKFINNPQGRRVLVNEWIAQGIFEQLRISAARVAAIELTPDFLAANPQVNFQRGSQFYPPDPGWHFGSRFADDPHRVGFYDFAPDQLMREVVNLTDFLGAMVVDRWLANVDARQAVFFRAKVKNWAPSINIHGGRVGFVTMMIDHGYTFGGPNWEFQDAAGYGIYHRPLVYESVTSLASFEPWLQQALYFPESVLESIRHSIPPQWIEGDEDRLDQLLHTLLQRRRKLPALLELGRSGPRNPFVNWVS